MNLLRISLTTKCNLECSYCPIAKWRGQVDPDYILCNETLLPFLDTLSPNKWFIELTGGEPGLYKELPELMQYLWGNKFKGLIKTNGLLPIPKIDGFKRVAAFHVLETPPKYFDEYLIVAQTCDWEAKQKYCIEHNIPYKFIGRNTYQFDRPHMHIEKQAFLAPSGSLHACDGEPKWDKGPYMQIKPGIPGDPGWIKPDVTQLPMVKCYGCKSVMDFELFMDGVWKNN